MTRIALVIGAVLVAGVMALPARTTEANGWFVNTTSDDFDGFCNAVCSLRDAIHEANNSQPPHDIYLPGGTFTLTRIGAHENSNVTGDLDLNNDIFIEGQGPEETIIQSGVGDRVFHVTGSVVIQSVTVRGGNINAEGGGILSTGSLTLSNTVVTGNTASGFDGGGVYNTGSLFINYSTLANNTASDDGGGLYSTGPTTIDNSTFTSNDVIVNRGGGVYLLNANSSISNSTFSGNTSNDYGGGLYYEGGTHNLTGSSIVGNSTGVTPGGGGGIFIANGSISVATSTISSNWAVDGAGIFNGGAFMNIDRSSVHHNIATVSGGGLLTYGITDVYNSTISGNVAGNQGGGINVQQSELAVINSTVARNSGASGAGIHNGAGALGGVRALNSILADSTKSGNCAGGIASNGFNISSDASCAFFNIGDFNNTSPLLGPLGLNGGPTRTHALLDGSPATDAGNPAVCLAVDQRGITRPQGLRCDMGAYEALDSDMDGDSDPLDPDDDNDSLPDIQDLCRTLAEDYDGYQDEGGCPDPDNDGDGICDPGLVSVSCSGADVGRYLWKLPLGGTFDCRNVTEDYDGFHDNDGCPEPDNDYDTFPDPADDCPGADSNAGPNGISDTGDEPILYLTPYQAREDFDGVIDTDGCHDSPDDDYDGDGAGDETEVFGMLTDPVNPDTDADAVIDGTDNCPNWANTSQSVPSWAIPANDSDCDGWNKTREQHVGSDPTKHCNGTSALNDEPDAWPTDFNDSRFTNLSDVSSFNPTYNKFPGDAGYSQRHDLNASNGVTLSDVSLMNAFYNKGCTS